MSHGENGFKNHNKLYLHAHARVLVANIITHMTEKHIDPNMCYNLRSEEGVCVCGQFFHFGFPIFGISPLELFNSIPWPHTVPRSNTSDLHGDGRALPIFHSSISHVHSCILLILPIPLVCLHATNHYNCVWLVLRDCRGMLS